MRRTFLITALLAAAFAVSPTVGSAAPASHRATVRVVVAPVTADGHAAPGFTVHPIRHPWSVVDCSFKDPSRGAISPNIENCGPSAAYAIACWKSATPKRVLCMQDPSKHVLAEMKRQGRFAPTKLAKPRDRAPLLIVLTDGSRCQIREGGAWGQPKGHPNLYGAYSCDKHGVAWLYAKGSHNDPHNGVDESSASWTIRTGNSQIVWRHIAQAYFVATAS